MDFLLVERDAERRRRIAELLTANGHNVLPAGDGELGAQALVGIPGVAVPGFDALVLGLALPGLDLERLRAALAPAAPLPPESLAAGERRQIALALAHTHGNKRQAARLLGVARSTLLSKIRRYGLT